MPWPFGTVLVANRGEIAVRIIRACRDLGLRSVAVYSEADKEALHVRLADEAVLLGPAQAAQSYLDIERLLDAAKKSGADAVHPGYGFLAENASFASQCLKAGLVFVGPSPEAIQALGDKTAARNRMAKLGLPVVPGRHGPEGRGFRDKEEALEAARALGFPVMLKAAAGGGGRGMRRVEDEATFGRDYESGQREAARAFGDGSLYVEKALEQPHHVEIQIVADAHGTVVSLGERECSVQRRYQKLIEETPAPCVTEGMRVEMARAAVAAARAVGYVGAGTVEFLVDKAGNFYFLEMNTRLQVEHPITEMCTGLDIVRLQFQVAAGERLGLTERDIAARGAAIECRICAEDPVTFMPKPGRLERFEAPAGPGIRVDAGVRAGDEVTPFYDSLLAKVIAWDTTRKGALLRMRRALHEFSVEGVVTNIPFHREVLAHPDFVEGRYDTSFVSVLRSKAR